MLRNISKKLNTQDKERTKIHKEISKQIVDLNSRRIILKISLQFKLI